MMILLPPSEAKSAEPGQGIFQDAHPELVVDTRAVLRHLHGLETDELGKFYGIKNSEKARAAHKLNLGALKADGMCALERYNGVVYGHLDYPGLRAKKRAARRIYVVSSMFGLIAGSTSIPNYKLPMNTWLANHWRECNAQRLHELRGRKIVLSLLPQSYAKAIDLENVITVQFKVEGGKKLAGHFGKAIKGRFVRFLIENNIASTKDFSDFTEEDFKFNGTDFIQK